MSQTISRELEHVKIFNNNGSEVLHVKSADAGMSLIIIDTCVPGNTYRIVYYNSDWDVIMINTVYIPNEITGVFAGSESIIVQYNHVPGQKVARKLNGVEVSSFTDSSLEITFFNLDEDETYDIYLKDTGGSAFDNSPTKTLKNDYVVNPSITIYEMKEGSIAWEVLNASGLKAKVYESNDLFGTVIDEHVINSDSEKISTTGLAIGSVYRIVIDDNVSFSVKAEVKENYFEYTSDCYHIIVQNAQEFLNAQIEDGNIVHDLLSKDGKCQENTRKALKAYQAKQHLISDGFLSKEIYDSLFDYWIVERFEKRVVEDQSLIFTKDYDLDPKPFDDYIQEWVYRFRNWISPFAGYVERRAGGYDDQILTNKGESAFQAQRSQGRRIHGAIDYRVKEKGNRAVYAVENGNVSDKYGSNVFIYNTIPPAGTVKKGPFTENEYWEGTGNIDLITRGVIISYAEITVNQQNFEIDTVTDTNNKVLSVKNNAVKDLSVPIGWTKNSSINTEMLHLMMFSDIESSTLLNSGPSEPVGYTEVQISTNRDGHEKSYYRRTDLLDPTFMKYLPYRRSDGTYID